MEQYNLSWHTYSEHHREMMQNMMICDDFKDVTLISDDKKSIKAHRNILSVCSPVFKKIFQMEINNHPVIYLRGIKYSEIKSILQFIYLGETKAYKDSLNDLLLIAKNFEIEEFSKNVEVGKLQYYQADHSQNYELQFESTTESIESAELKEKFDDSDEIQSSFKGESSIKSKGSMNFELEATNQGNHPKHVESIQEDVEIQATTTMELTSQIQSKHPDVKYACNQCDYKAKQQSNLKTHIESKHNGVKYACNQCDYQATKQGNLKAHIQSKHEGVRYACNQCDYQALHPSSLKSHIQNRHEGVKYACNQCDYQATQRGNLTTHIQHKHDSVKYGCTQCLYKASDKISLRKHVDKIHNTFV